MKLSPETKKRVDLLFIASERKEAVRILAEECGNNLPFCEKSDEFELERIRFAALKLSAGKLIRLQGAIELAKLDWRDLLMSAGFGNNAHAHKTWLPDKRKK